MIVFSRPALVGFCCFLLSASAHAQDVTDGFLLTERSVYAESATRTQVDRLPAGLEIRVEHEYGLVYRAYRRGSSALLGYVIYPKLSKTAPDAGAGLPPATTIPVPATGRSVTRYTMDFVNVRQWASPTAPVFAQLLPGVEIQVWDDDTNWLRIYPATQRDYRRENALGYVPRRLLRAAPPDG